MFQDIIWFILEMLILIDQARRAGSKLKSRIVAEQSIIKWSHIIEQMEDQIAGILEEERLQHIWLLEPTSCSPVL